MSTDEYVPSLETLLNHYEELSLTVSGDPEVAKGNRREAEKSLDRVRRDAAREAEARIKAVEDLCDDADKRHASVLIVTTVRRALDT